MRTISESGEKIRNAYRRWWLGNFCRKANSDNPFKLVVDMQFAASPSFVYGSVELIYDDGKREFINNPNSFRPRKSDVEVKPY